MTVTPTLAAVTRAMPSSGVPLVTGRAGAHRPGPPWRSEHPGVPIEVHRVDGAESGLGRGVVDIAIPVQLAWPARQAHGAMPEFVELVADVVGGR